MFARNARGAVAINYFLATSPVAQHRVRVATAFGEFILAKLDGADFRVKRAGVLNGVADLLFRFQDEQMFLAFRV